MCNVFLTWKRRWADIGCPWKRIWEKTSSWEADPWWLTMTSFRRFLFRLKSHKKSWKSHKPILLFKCLRSDFLRQKHFTVFFLSGDLKLNFKKKKNLFWRNFDSGRMLPAAKAEKVFWYFFWLKKNLLFQQLQLFLFFCKTSLRY